MSHARRPPCCRPGALTARVAAVVVSLAAGALPESTSAQTIVGTVIDDTNDRPVPGAAVGLVLNDRVIRAVEADELGRFRLSAPEPGAYAIEVERFGYREARSGELTIELGDTLAVEFRVLPDAVLLEPLLVTGSSRAGRNQFARRRDEWGQGIHLGPEQIDSIAPEHVGDVFRGLEKVRLSWGWGTYAGGSSGPLPSVRTYLGRGCLLYMVDRVPVRPSPWIQADWASDQLSGLRPADVVAVEVYRHVDEVPPELRRYSSQSRWVYPQDTDQAGIPPSRRERVSGRPRIVDRDLCGVVVIWTRAGW